VDVQCWCPEDEPDARRRFTETQQAIHTAGGVLIDSSFRYASGLSLIRADVPAGEVMTLAHTDRVRWISLLPRPLLSTPEMVGVQASGLPPVLPASPDGPIVAVIDSASAQGIRCSPRPSWRRYGSASTCPTVVTPMATARWWPAWRCRARWSPGCAGPNRCVPPGAC
jgi:hypothetical protein